LNLEKGALNNDDLAKRCVVAERERDEIHLQLEHTQHANKLLQQSFNAEKKKHDLTQKELTDRLQKITNDLDKMTRDHTGTFDELNELKKKLLTTQNELILLQKRMADLVKRNISFHFIIYCCRNF
jgi:arsenate reductase-like glutaredoxin family protein